MKYTPVFVGAGVGLLHGQVIQAVKASTSPPSTVKTYAPGIIKFGALLLGFASEVTDHLTPGINYGLMTAASALIGANVPNAVQAGSLTRIATNVVYDGYPIPADHTRPTVAGAIDRHEHEHPTIAGKTAAACTACAHVVEPRRIGERRATTGLPVNMTPTMAG